MFEILDVMVHIMVVDRPGNKNYNFNQHIDTYLTLLI